MLKVVAWNIRQGGGRNRMPAILLALLEQDPDVVVMSEVRRTTAGPMGGVLAEHGFIHQAQDVPMEGNGVILASRTEIFLPEDEPQTPAAAGRFILAEVGEVSIAAVHAPDRSDAALRTAYWSALASVAGRRRDGACMVIGDFNAAGAGLDRMPKEGDRHRADKDLGRLMALGFSDAFRVLNPGAAEFSWYSHRGRGFRIDHAYVSEPLLKRVKSARYSHAEREAELSDHSLLAVTIAGE